MAPRRDTDRRHESTAQRLLQWWRGSQYNTVKLWQASHGRNVGSLVHDHPVLAVRSM